MIQNTSHESNPAEADAGRKSNKPGISISFVTLVFLAVLIGSALPIHAKPPELSGSGKKIPPGMLLLSTTDTVTQKFPATGDATIDENLPHTNFGVNPFLYVGYVDMTGTPATRSVLKFDLSSLPPGTAILRARMKVYVNACVVGRSAHLAAYRLRTPWHQLTTTWTAPWSIPGGDFDETAVIWTPIVKTDVGTWKELDVTPWVQHWAANPAEDNGVLLRLINQTSITQYQLSSSENAIPELAPVLTVEYTAPQRLCRRGGLRPPLHENKP